MRKLICAVLLTGIAGWAQQSTATIEGKNITLKYTPAGGKISASFHTDADLVFKGVTVPKGDYILYVLNDGPTWQLVINLATGTKAAIGKVVMKVVQGAVAPNRVTVTKTAALAAKIEVVTGTAVATAQFHLDKVAGDTEW